MASIAIMVHQDHPLARELALDLIEWLDDRGHELRLPEHDARLVGRADLGWHEAELGAGLDLAVTLGGDGSILRTFAMVASHEVPVLGVNLGQLGYLAEVEPHGARVAIGRFLAGSHSVEQRMMLDVVGIEGSVEGIEVQAVNEMVIERSPVSRMIRVEVLVDGRTFTTLAADGVIVATPTGSTAYSLSARGPVVAPAHRALVLTPVAPHMLWDRSLVLDPANTIELRVLGDRPAGLSVDGRTVANLEPGDVLRATASKRSARLVTFAERDFLSVLKDKFGLEDR